MNILSPSSAARRIACPASYKLEAISPASNPSSVAIEGTYAHKIAAEILKNLNKNYKYCKNFKQLLLEYQVKDELIEHIAIYVNDIITILRQEKLSPHHLKVETTLDIPIVHPNCSGTPDAFLYSPFQDTLYIWDFKYGYTSVDVFENWQLIEYAFGILSHEKYVSFKNTTRIIFTIVQPRDYHRSTPVDRWAITLSDLQKYLPSLRRSENLAFNKSDKMSPSEHCNFCRAKTICPGLKRTTAIITDVLLTAPDKITNTESIGKELKSLKLVEKILKSRMLALETEIENKLIKGLPVDNYTLEASYGKREWNKPQIEIIELGKKYKIDLLKEPGLITPAQAELRGISRELINAHAARRKTGFKLTELTDTHLRRIFNE